MAMTREQVKQHIQRLAHGQDSFTSDGQRLALDLLDTDAALRTKLEAMERDRDSAEMRSIAHLKMYTEASQQHAAALARVEQLQEKAKCADECHILLTLNNCKGLDASCKPETDLGKLCFSTLKQLLSGYEQANKVVGSLVAERDTLDKRVTALEMAIQPVAFVLEEFEIVPIGLSREQELYWKKAVKDIRSLLPPPGAHTKETP